MKKGLFISCLLLLSFGILSCSFDKKEEEEEKEKEVTFPFSVYQLNFDNKKTKEQTFDNNKKGYKGYVYLAKYNTSNYFVEEEDTGKVTDISPSIIGNISLNKLNNNKQIIYDYASVTEMQREQRNIIYQMDDYNDDFKSNTLSRSALNEKDSFYILKSTKSEDKDYNKYDKVFISNGTLEKKYNGKFCTVYYTDANNSDYANYENYNEKLQKENLFKKVADKFDSIYELETKYLGSNSYTVSDTSKYVNTDTKVNIMIMDINHDAVNKQQYITLGFYQPGDLIKLDYSNRSQVLYLDSYALLNMENTLYSTIVHEFNHLLNDINKTIKSNEKLKFETWYTEMLSMISEDMFSEYLGLTFKDTPRSRLYSSKFRYFYPYGFLQWTNNNRVSADDVLIFYCNAFAYGSFLVRNFGGVDFVKEIATNGEVNSKSIEEAIKKFNYNISFEDSIKCYYKATINTKKTGATFNKGVEYNSDGLGFKVINLSNLARNSSGEEYSAIPDYANPDEQLELFPSGCTFHYLGQDISSFTIEKPDSSHIEMEVICLEEEL